MRYYVEYWRGVLLGETLGASHEKEDIREIINNNFIIKQIYRSRTLTITEVHKEIGVDSGELKHVINKLKRLGVSLKPDIAFSAYNVKRIQVIIPGYILHPDVTLGSKSIERAPYLRSVSTLLPDSVMVVAEVFRSENIVYGGEKYCIYESIGARPSYKALLETVRATRENTLDRLLDLSWSLEIMYYADDVEIFPKHRAPDSIDLEILRLTSKFPWITKRKLTELVGRDLGKDVFRERTLNVHLRHASRMIRGYRVSRISPLRRISSNSLLLFTDCGSYENMVESVRQLITHPLVLGVSILGPCNIQNIDSLIESDPSEITRVEVQAYVPTGYYTRVLALFANLLSLRGCTVNEVKAVDLGSTIVFTVGSKVTGEYDPKLRRYKSMSIGEILEEDLVRPGVIVPVRGLEGFVSRKPGGLGFRLG